ncbi:antitoxin [Buttiauxella gaviniae]|uniref:antitoxin n=1 Tax=Buttiauxella gaviniae TaxID=82990 RepID=UPI0039748634
MSNKYIVILQRAWCNDSGLGISYDSDLTEFDTRDEAKAHGFNLRDSDDFNIGVISGDRLVSFDWMDTPTGNDDDVLAEIAESIGLEPTHD